MSYTLLVKKLYLDGKKIVGGTTIREYCRKLNMDYGPAIGYLLRLKYAHRILRGIFYLPTIEERESKRIDINLFDAVAEALKIKGVKNWYFGLETALKMNNLTHEFFTTEMVVNDTISRPKPISLLGYKVRFLKAKANLFRFGIIRKRWKISDREKTVLDIIYFSKYAGLTGREVEKMVAGLINLSSKRKLRKYAKYYNKRMERFIHEKIN